jgi:endonuclease G, mitochondrial
LKYVFYTNFAILIFLFGSIQAQDLLPKSSGQLIRHSHFTLSYAENHRQAEWVFYELTPHMTEGGQSRTNDFRPDPNISSGSAQLVDYAGSGYDRGHLCPAGDMKFDKISMSQTFYLSNMSPQTPSFNRGIWKKLEEKVRFWAESYGLIYVVTGGILQEGQSKIGPNGITVPAYFYKVIYHPGAEAKMIALILPNAKSDKALMDFVVSVDSVESLTGIDFFPDPAASYLNTLEEYSDIRIWFSED